jgi:hypothetical protein
VSHSQRFRNELNYRFDPVGEISPVHRRISSACRVTPRLQEDVFEVGFRRRPGDAERCGSLGQRETAEQAGEQAVFDWRQTKGGSHGVCTILRVGWRSDEHGGNGRGLQSRAEIGAREGQDVSEDGRGVGLGRRMASPVLPMPASLRATGMSEVTSNADVPRRGSPLRLRTICGLSSDLRAKKSWAKDLLLGAGNVFEKISELAHRRRVLLGIVLTFSWLQR